MASHHIHEAGGLGLEVAKATPPLAVTGAALAGLPLSTWVTILTLVYLLLQIGLLIPKYAERIRAWRRARRVPVCRSEHG